MMKAHTTLVNSSYAATADDYYIGVDAKKAVTITLPIDPEDGRIIIVKAEMRPPSGDRRITIESGDGSSIDGYSKRVIYMSNESVHLLYRGHCWHVI